MRAQTTRPRRIAFFAAMTCLTVGGAVATDRAPHPGAGVPPAPPAAPPSDWKLSPERRAAIEALGATLVAAIHATDEAARAELIHQAYAPEAIAEATVERIAGQLAAVGQRFPGLVFDRAALTETLRGSGVSRALHVYARRPGDRIWRDLQLYVSETEPHRLTQLVFIAEVTEPIALPNGAISSRETLEWLNGYVDRLEQESGLSGSALIAMGDRVIFERYFATFSPG